MSCGDWSRCAIFDVDGVLIDSRPLVEEAYRQAGVEMPDDAWGKPWDQWLPGLLRDEVEVARVRLEKRQAYIHLLRQGVMRLPPAEVAASLDEEGHSVRFVTGASRNVAPHVLAALNLPPMSLPATEMDLAGKVAIAALWQRRGYRVVYVDDDPAVQTALVAVRGVWYHGQSAATLRNEMEEAWTR